MVKLIEEKPQRVLNVGTKKGLDGAKKVIKKGSNSNYKLVVKKGLYIETIGKENEGYEVYEVQEGGYEVREKFSIGRFDVNKLEEIVTEVRKGTYNLEVDEDLKLKKEVDKISECKLREKLYELMKELKTK